jgi:WD40 repeat protein
MPKRSLAVPERTVESDVLIEVNNLQLDKVRTIQYSPNGSHLAIVTQDGIELRDVHSLQLMRKLALSSGAESIDFDGTGKLLASVSRNGVYLWDINTGERVWRYQDKHNTIYDVALDGEGDFLAVAMREYAIILYPKRATGRARKFAGIVDRCSYVALTKKRHLLAVAGQGGVRLWNLNVELKDAEVKKFNLSRNLIMGVTISNDDSQLVILVSNNQMSRYSVVIESLLTYEQVQRIEIPFVQVMDLALANGRFVSVGSHKGHLWIWDLDQQNVSTHLTDCGRISSLDFSPDGQSLCTATYDGEVRIYRLDL